MDPNTALNTIRESADEIQHDLGEAFDEHSQVGSLITAFDALDTWLKRGGFLPAEWAQNRTSEHLYEKCRDCHLFIDDNPAADDGPDIAPYIHLARGNAADERLDADHEPVPSGMKANLATWRVFGPRKMRERFVTPEEWASY